MRNRPRVVVLDDDSTGSQAARGVRVLLRPDLPAAERWLRSAEPALYVVTNTRSMLEAEAVQLIRQFAGGIADLARGQGQLLTFVLRGDSTLRGHVIAEIDCLASPESVALFVPAYPEGGRVTIGGIHYLRRAGTLFPVAETEFARDPVFGYRDSYLPDWLAARAPDRQIVLVPLETVRRGPAAVSDLLSTVPARTIVVPDLESVGDAEIIAEGLRAAQAGGRQVTLRSAATVPAMLASVYSSGFLTRHTTRTARTLVVCGSHTQASTSQLDALRAETGIRGVELPAASDVPVRAEVTAAAAQLRQVLEADGIALLSTARERPAEMSALADGASVMTRLTAVARAVRGDVEACVVKGGITSAEVALTAFDALEAMVQGQLEAGVSLWTLLHAAGREMDYVVVPGNMGGDGTLIRSVAAVTKRRPHVMQPR